MIKEKEQLIIDFMQGKVISEKEKELIIKYYKELLEEGKYIAMNKERGYFISSKNPEMNLKQKANYKHFCENIFLRA